MGADRAAPNPEPPFRRYRRRIPARTQGRHRAGCRTRVEGAGGRAVDGVARRAQRREQRPQRDDRRRARHRARRHAPVQDAGVQGLRDGPGRPHVAHGDRRAQSRHSGVGRRAAGERADPAERPDHRRWRSWNRDRRSGADRARGIFLPAKRKGARAEKAPAPEVLADPDARRHEDRTVREHRIARRRADGAWKRARWASACSAPNSCS